MPGSQVLIHAVLGQRQVTGRRDDSVLADDHRSVVKRRILFKNIDEQLACYQRVHVNSRAGVFLKRSCLFNDDQSAGVNL